jgi:hypothetical protein
MIRQRTDDWEISFQLSWQRLLALLLALTGVVVLGFGLIRPMLSAYLGREVSRQMNAEIAREVVVILAGEVIAPDNSAPAASAGESAASAPAAQGAGQGAAPNMATSAGQGAAPDIATSAGQGSAPVAPSIPGGQAPIDSASILRAVAERPAQAERPEPATVEQPAERAPGAPVAEQPAVGAPNTPPVSTAPNTPAEPRSAEEIVAALPSGTLTISEEKVNARIVDRAAALGPIDSLAVRFLPGQVQVRIDVLGQQSMGTAELTVTEGRVVAQDPALSGPLSLFISAADLVKPIEDELNAILAAAEREVTGVQVSEGELVVTLK